MLRNTRGKAGAQEVGAQANTSTSPTVEVVTPGRGGMRRTTVQPGTVMGYESVDLYAMVSGYLKTQAVDIGSRIRKGEVLAVIDAPREAKALDEAASLVEAVEGADRAGRGSDQDDGGRARGRRRPSSRRRNRTSTGSSPLAMLAQKQLDGCEGLVADRAADAAAGG